MKKRPANKAFALLLSMLLCASLATVQVPWAAYAVDGEGTGAGSVETGIDGADDDNDGVDDDTDENDSEPDELDADEEEVLGEAESTLPGDVICIASEAVELEDEKQQGDDLAAQADGDIASGTLGECKWIIDANGTLTITPGTGNSFDANWRYFDDAPWFGDERWAKKIRSVQIRQPIHASGSLYAMFEGCSSLTSLDLSGLDTSSVTNMMYMFYGCSSLTSLDLSGLDTSSVGGMYGMFLHCSSLTSLNLMGLDTSSVTDMRLMFYDCSSLTSLDLSGFDTGSVTDMYGMFGGCGSLDTVKLGSRFSFKGANGLTGDPMTELPGGNWLSDVANKNQVYTASQIAQDRNDLADTYYKVNLIKDVSVIGIDAPTAKGVAKPVDLTLQAADGALATNTATSSWQGDFAKDSDGNDTFVAGNTYTLPVDVALGNRSVRDDGFALSAPDGFTVTPGAFGGTPVGPMGQTYAFTLSYTVPPAGEHVVTLDLGNGNAPTNVNIVDGEKLQRPADPTREGYTFDGWLLDGNLYDFDTPVTSNMTLTAKWVKQESPAVTEYVVTLDPGNGDAVTTVKVTDGNKLQRPADPTREGFRFDGWLLDGNPYDFDAPVTSNMTLTAKWVEQEPPVVTPDEPDPEPAPTPDPEPAPVPDEQEPSPAPTGLPPKTLDTIGLPAGLILLACVLIASMVGINRRKAYEAAKSHFHYERYAYLNERKRSPFRWFWR